MNNTRTNPDALTGILNHAADISGEAEIFSLKSNAMSVSLRNGEVREINEYEEAGICLRLIRNGRLAQVSSSNPDQMGSLPKRAAELVPHGKSVSFSFPGAGKLPEAPLNAPLDLSMDAMIDTCRKMTAVIAEEAPELVTSASVSYQNQTIRILNSGGFDFQYTQPAYSSGISAVFAEEGNILQTYRTHLGQHVMTDPETLGAKVLELIRLGKNTVDFPGGKIAVLLTPHAVSDIMAALGAGISGSNVTKGISPLTGKLGTRIATEGISILDDPLYPDATGSQPFDDEGTACQTKYIIKDGVLENYLLDLDSARKLDLEPKGNGFRYTSLIKSRSYKAAPGPSFTNLIIPAGEHQSETIISRLPRVLVIDQLTGVLLGNLTNGDWSGNIEYGILYEKGLPRGRVKNAMTGGNLYTMLKDHYRESSSDRQWVTGFGGGSGSSLFPHMLFDNMNISL